MSADIQYLTLPGLNGSGETHWQSHWEADLPHCTRVEQADWDDPVLIDWLEALEQSVTLANRPVCLIAHSLSCALVARWAGQSRQADKVQAALLAAPADVDDPAHVPDVALRFGPMPLAPLPFATVVVASANDPFVTPERAASFATAWGADLRLLQGLGHLNDQSALGAWPEGRHILDGLIGQSARRKETGT